MADFQDTTIVSRRTALANLAALSGAAAFAAVPITAGATTPAVGDGERIATTEEWAEVEFEPWQHAPGEVEPPTNQEWARLANPHLVNVRIAWVMMHKTKAELIEVLENIDEETGNELKDGFIATIGFFEDYLRLMKAAETRILCAGAALEVCDSA